MATLQEERDAYKAMLKRLEWAAANHTCCPFCGGNRELSGHSTMCKLAALLYQDRYDIYYRQHGVTVIADALFEAQFWDGPRVDRPLPKELDELTEWANSLPGRVKSKH